MNLITKKIWIEPLSVLAIAIFLAAIVFVANSDVQGPMIQADEGSYLSNAAAIAGFHNDMASSYKSGYSALISPAFLLGSAPSEIWMIIKAINSGLFFSVVILLWLISKKMKPNLSLSKRSQAVVLVSAYPMWVIMTGYSFSQIAFVPFYLLMFFFFLEAALGKSYAWPTLGGVSGFLYWIHPTAIVALIAVCISLFYVSWKQGWYKNFFIFLTLMMATVFTYSIYISPWLMEKMTISGQAANLHYPSISKLFSVISSLDGIKKLLSVFGGHIFYISLGTLGFIVSGFFILTAMVLKASKKELIIPEALMLKAGAIFLILSLVGSIMLSSIFMSGVAVRLDHWMYGRYVEGFIAPIILVGVLADSWCKTLWAIPMAVLGAGLLYMSLDLYVHTAPFNVSTFWQEFFIRNKGLPIWLLAGIAIVALIGLLPRQASYLVALGFFCFCSYLQIDYHNRASKNAVSRWDAAMMVRNQYPSGTCVGFDHSGINGYNRHIFWFDFGFVLFNYRLQRISFDKWIETCDGPLFSYDKHLNDQNSEVYPVAVSPHGGPILWGKGKTTEFESYPITVSENSIMLFRVLGDGWHSLERTHVWSSDNATINLKKSMFASDKWPTIMKLDISAYAASKDHPVTIDVKENGHSFNFNYTESGRNTIEFLLSCKPDDKQCNIEFSINNATSPKILGRSSDARVLGFALYSFTFEGL